MSNETKRHDDDADLLAAMIRAAGRREDPPADARAAALSAASDAWRAKVRRARARSLLIRIAAAVAVVAVVAALIVDRTPPLDRRVATLDRSIGLVQTRVAGDMTWSNLGDRMPGINTGNWLRTDARARAGILLVNGISLRLAAETEIQLESLERIRLITGRIYIDTGIDSASADDSLIEIVTPVGSTRDLGTQFEIRYDDDDYRLRVREGRVVLAMDQGNIESSAGEQLTIDPAGLILTAEVPRDDPEWQWVESVAPAPSIENEPVTVLLEWVARETGRPLRYSDSALERKAEQTILHGNIRYLAPMEALDVMLASTDLGYDLRDDGTILIRQKAAP